MKLKRKLIASILTVMMLMGYITTLTNAVIAVGTNLSGQNSKTNNVNVEFNSYFEGEVHSKTFGAGKEAKMYVKIKVSNVGYLKNGVVQFNNANFEVDSNNLKNEIVQSSSKNEIKLKQVNNSSNETVIEVPITMVSGEEVNSNIFAQTSEVKFTGTYIDGDGKERAIEKKIENEVKWKGAAEVELAGEVSKYIPYEKGEEKGVLVQLAIQSGVKENSLPVKSTKLEVSVPEIKITEENTVKPTRITVIANSTKGTNGKGVNEFSEGNYKYNEETGKIEITVENKEENGKISWKKQAKDEYLVNYVYTGEEVYNYVKEQINKAKETIKTEEEIKAGQTNENAIIGEIEVKAEVETYNSEETKVSKEGPIKYSIEKEKGELVNSFINNTQKVSKGYIYANYAKAEKEARGEEIEGKKGTKYEVTYGVQINDKELVDEIKIGTQRENYVDAEGKKYSSKVGEKENIYTKTVKISEEVFNKMLGEEGKIEITTKGENAEKIGEITKGNYIVDISDKKVNKIEIKTSKPVTEGNIEITVEKEISGEQTYTKEQMESFTKIEVEESKEIEWAEPVSKAQISVGTQRLSTVVENKDVELRVVLDTSSTENALYKNPVLQIDLPESIEKINLKSVELFLEDELKVEDYKIVENDGRKSIVINLNGTQTKYMPSGKSDKTNKEIIISKGANIIIKADITFKKLTPNEDAQILLYYTNENTNLFENYKQSNRSKTRAYSASRASTPAVGLATTSVPTLGSIEVATLNEMTGFKGEEKIEWTSKETTEKIIDIYGEAKEVMVGGTIANNSTDNIEHVMILGRLPFEGNKNPKTQADLGSNFTMKMKQGIKVTSSEIDTSKVIVYYSANENATKDIMTNQSNGWTTDISGLSEVKSYLIVISPEVTPGAKIKFEYKAELPGNLPYGKSTYTTYNVYYDMSGTTNGYEETAGTIGLTTGEGPDLEVKLTSNMAQNSEVREGQIVRYNVTVTNKGQIAAKNAVANITVPEGTTLVKYNSYYKKYEEISDSKVTLGTIESGKTVSANYDLLMKELATVETSDEENAEAEKVASEEITTQVKITSDNVSNGVPSNNYTLKKLAGKMTIINATSKAGNEILYKGDKLYSSIYVKANESLSNAVLTINIPQGIKINDIYYYKEIEEIRDNIQTNNNKITITIPSLESITVKLELEVESLVGDFNYMVTGTAYGVGTHYSNCLEYKVASPNVKITQTSSNEKYVKEAEQIKYEFTIENTGDIEIQKFAFEDKIPSELSFVKMQYTYDGKTEEVNSTLNNTANFKLDTFKAGSTCKVILTAKANLLDESKKDKEVNNSAEISANGVNTIKSNIITNIIEYNPKLYEGNGGNQGSSTTPGTTGRPGDITSNNSVRYKITGTAWVDSNRDGKRDENETLLSDVQVMLINKTNSQIVIDVDNGSQKITTTGSDGKYEFTNIPLGEYQVLFLYDAGKYSITDCQAKDVSASYNSDAIKMKITLDGEQKFVGVADNIKITNGHARDIDIGLYVEEKFDLRLDKYINKITVTTPSSGTKAYNYNNSKITKREVLGKDVGKNSNMVIEYKIVVTNEGQIPGYARKIIDYLPDNVSFNTELNKDWYMMDNNGAILNASLANEKIEPGQSKEVKLILSVNINEKTIGTNINNNAEIYESYNEQGVEDYDSTEANRLETEDDMSNADVILSTVTGSIILYTTLGIAILFLIAMGVMMIKSKVLTKEDY